MRSSDDQFISEVDWSFEQNIVLDSITGFNDPSPIDPDGVKCPLDPSAQALKGYVERFTSERSSARKPVWTSHPIGAHSANILRDTPVTRQRLLVRAGGGTWRRRGVRACPPSSGRRGPCSFCWHWCARSSRAPGRALRLRLDVSR